MDTIFVKTTHRFPFWGRVKILLGAPLICETEIKVEHDDVKVIGNAKTKGMIGALIPKKSKGIMYKSND